MWAFAHSSQLRRWTAVRSRPWWGRRACRWASLRRFLTVCAEILWVCKPIFAAAVWVAGLRPSWRWSCQMWRSWAGVVTCGLQLWGRLDVLPNCLNRLWRQLMVEKWTFSSGSAALVEIPAVSKPTSVALCNVIKLNILVWPVLAWPAYSLDMSPSEHVGMLWIRHVYVTYMTMCSSSCQYPAALHSHSSGVDQHSTGHDQQLDQLCVKEMWDKWWSHPQTPTEKQNCTFQSGLLLWPD